MESIFNVYKKRLSKIGTLQNEKLISYGVIESVTDGEVRYGIRLLVEENGATESDSLKEISGTKNEILDIVTFLYENSVQLANWREITCDILIHCMAED